MRGVPKLMYKHAQCSDSIHANLHSGCVLPRYPRDFRLATMPPDLVDPALSRLYRASIINVRTLLKVNSRDMLNVKPAISPPGGGLLTLIGEIAGFSASTVGPKG